MSAHLKNVTVVGSGNIGRQIALNTAAGGYNVTLVDRNQEILDASKKILLEMAQSFCVNYYNNHKGKENPDSPALHNLKEAIDHNNFSTITNRIHYEPDLAKGVAHADLIVEAVFERLSLKQEVFQQIEAVAPKTTVIVTNTSSIKPSDVLKPIHDKTRAGALHWFGPVERKRLLEVGKISETSEDTLQKLLEYGKTIGKTTIVCKDSPGLLANRFHIMLRMEALYMVEQGIASPADIDIALKLGYELPVGVFEHMDTTPGLDTQYDILNSFYQYRDEVLTRPQPSKILEQKVKENNLGKKTGYGFYHYQ